MRYTIWNHLFILNCTDTTKYNSLSFNENGSAAGGIQRLGTSFSDIVVGTALQNYTEIYSDGRYTGGKAGITLLVSPSAGVRHDLSMNKDGNVGIGTLNQSHPFEMASGAYVSSGGVWTNASSREYKKNIEKLSAKDAFETLEGLEPVSFKYKANNEQHLGFIAEDVPEKVAQKDRKGLSSMDMVAVLTKVLKEQQKMMHDHQKMIKEQEKTIAELKKELGTIKSIENKMNK